MLMLLCLISPQLQLAKIPMRQKVLHLRNFLRWKRSLAMQWMDWKQRGMVRCISDLRICQMM
uniref:Uncharacterized protein n=1 Tax=Rhizophora mucronata TaxID=61149 RepID=A0A2P2QFJ5_RHIMU